MFKPTYFTFEELVYSDTAVKKKIQNIPTWDDIEHIRELALFLDAMREEYGKPIFVSSGFRCAKLNKAVGGKDTSVHKIGYAVDLYVKGGKKEMDKFGEWLKDWLKSSGRSWDQLITETSSTGGYWYHLGLYNNKGEQRRMIFGLAV